MRKHGTLFLTALAIIIIIINDLAAAAPMIQILQFLFPHRKHMNCKLTCAPLRSARGAKPLEVIGTYNPVPKQPTNLYDENANARAFKEVALDRSRTKYWLGVGAQPSDPVWKLLSMVSEVLDAGVMRAGPLGVVLWS